MTKYLLAFLFLFPLVACAQGDTPTPADPNTSVSSPVMTAPVKDIEVPTLPAPESCNPPVSLVGKDKSVLDTMRFKNPIRVLGPNTPATMDYNSERINIMTDDKGVITEVKCG